MRLRTLVVSGTTGPIYRAILRVADQYTKDHGLPTVMQLTAHGHDVYLVADEDLCDAVVLQLPGVWYPDRWPWNGDVPTSCDARFA